MQMREDLKSLISQEIQKKGYDEVADEIKDYLFEQSPRKEHPVDRVRWVDVNDVIANDYNPNSVAVKEMSLLLTSIKRDGYTQPVVVVWDEEKKKYVIVDGFHRTTVMKNNKDLQETTQGKLPVVVLDKDINDRMAATVRHNRARGTHSVVSMSEMVFSMKMQGWEDKDIANELGMEAEEINRLKHITGYSSLYKDHTYNNSWETMEQIKLRKELKDKGEEYYDGN